MGILTFFVLVIIIVFFPLQVFGITWPQPPEGELPGGKLGSMIFTDFTNNRLGVYTRAPQGKYLIQGDKESASGLIAAVGIEVTGTGSFFSQEFEVGDQISVGGETRVVMEIIDDENLVINTSFPIDFEDQAYEQSESMFIILSDGSIGLGETFPSNRLDVSGGVVIGMSYSGIKIAPENGLLVEGAVGIGTDDPQSKLDIAGGVSIGTHFAGHSAAPPEGMLVEGAIGVGTYTPMNKMDIEGNVVIGSTYSGTSSAPEDGLLVEGKVGIGTDNPQSSVQIDGTDALRIPVGNTDERPENQLSGQIRYNTELSQYEGSDGESWGSLGGAIDVDQDTQIHVEKSPDEDKIRFDTLGIERMIIDSNGNVGINTTFPQGKLQVQGDRFFGAGTLSSVARNIVGVNTQFDIQVKAGDEIMVDGNTRIVTSVTDATHMIIGIPFESDLINQEYLVGATRLRVDGSGDTIINGDLTVMGTANLNAVINTENVSVDQITSPKDHDFNLQTWETGDADALDRITVKADGKVGIGEVNPVTTLDIDGGVAFNVVEKTSDYIATPKDNIILCNADSGHVTITLPQAFIVEGLELTIKKMDTTMNTCTIKPNGTELIDGYNRSLDFYSQFVTYTVISDGARWWVK